MVLRFEVSTNQERTDNPNIIFDVNDGLLKALIDNSHKEKRILFRYIK